MNLFPDMCRCDSDIFGDDLLGTVQRVEGDLAVVRLELDEDHPAMMDAQADGFDPEVAEFIDYIPLTSIRTTYGDPWKDIQS